MVECDRFRLKLILLIFTFTIDLISSEHSCRNSYNKEDEERNYDEKEKERVGDTSTSIVVNIGLMTLSVIDLY